MLCGITVRWAVKGRWTSAYLSLRILEQGRLLEWKHLLQMGTFNVLNGILSLKPRDKVAMLDDNTIEIFLRNLHGKGLSSQGREMLLFASSNVAAVKSRANQQYEHLLTKTHVTYSVKPQWTSSFIYMDIQGNKDHLIIWMRTHEPKWIPHSIYNDELSIFKLQVWKTKNSYLGFFGKKVTMNTFLRLPATNHQYKSIRRKYPLEPRVVSRYTNNISFHW